MISWELQHDYNSKNSHQLKRTMLKINQQEKWQIIIINNTGNYKNIRNYFKK